MWRYSKRQKEVFDVGTGVTLARLVEQPFPPIVDADELGQRIAIIPEITPIIERMRQLVEDAEGTPEALSSYIELYAELVSAWDR